MSISPNSAKKNVSFRNYRTFRVFNIYMCVLLTSEELDEFIASALYPESEGDRGQLADGVESELHVLVAELVDEHSDRVERRVVSLLMHRVGRHRCHSLSFLSTLSEN